MKNIWFWISIIEFLFIVFLFYRLYRKTEKLSFSDLSDDDLKKARNEKIDMGNIVNSINMSRNLYKELSTFCHPDRFVNSPKQPIAEDIFKEVSKHKRNYKELLQLKERATKELEVLF